MLERYTNNKLTWVDLREPTIDEIREVMEEYSVAPELMSDLTRPVPRSEAVHAPGSVKITLDFPVVRNTHIESAQEIKFIVSKTHLVTVRYEDIAAVHQFSKELEVISALDKTGKKAHGGHLLIALLTTLYDALSQKLDYIESRLSDIEKEIFDEHEKEMVPEISNVSRRLITFRQTLSVHEEVFDTALVPLEALFGKTFRRNVEELKAHFGYLMRRVTALNEALEELRDTNNALLTTKQNEIMKILTIMAFITFPLTLFTSMFGMNTKTLPIVGREGDFWMILGIMAAVTVGFFGYFKYKRWI